MAWQMLLLLMNKNDLPCPWKKPREKGARPLQAGRKQDHSRTLLLPPPAPKVLAHDDGSHSPFEMLPFPRLTNDMSIAVRQHPICPVDGGCISSQHATSTATTEEGVGKSKERAKAPSSSTIRMVPKNPPKRPKLVYFEIVGLV